MIHSVNSLKLISEINKQAIKNNLTMDILLEVNISEEESKIGIFPGEIYDIIDNIYKFSNIRVKGLMTMGKKSENAEVNRKLFRDLKQLSVDISRQKVDNIKMRYLSMGMSLDYSIAIEEGSNIIRLGSTIFKNKIN